MFLLLLGSECQTWYRGRRGFWTELFRFSVPKSCVVMQQRRKWEKHGGYFKLKNWAFQIFPWFYCSAIVLWMSAPSHEATFTSGRFQKKGAHSTPYHCTVKAGADLGGSIFLLSISASFPFILHCLMTKCTILNCCSKVVRYCPLFLNLSSLCIAVSFAG